MATMRNKILDAVKDRLNDSRPGNVPIATRLKTLPIDVNQFPSLTLYPGDEPVDSIHGRNSPSVERTLTMHAEIRTAGEEPDKLADPILEWITKQLGGYKLPTVQYPNGLINDLQEARTQWRVAQHERPFLVTLVSIDIRYMTKRDDQSVRA